VVLSGVLIDKIISKDYADRLVLIYKGKHLELCALGKEELILMKCFAGREKDIPHVRALIKKNPDLKIVDKRLEELMNKRIPQASKAADFFDDICSQLGVAP